MRVSDTVKRHYNNTYMVRVHTIILQAVYRCNPLRPITRE